MSDEKNEEFEIVCAGEVEEIEKSSREAAAGYQVIVQIENQHGVAVGGKVYARIGLSKTISQIVGVLHGKTRTFDFRTDSGTITRVWSDELGCGHTKQHTFGFEIKNPKNGQTYYGKIS